jgi:hypothetical protein
MQCSAPLESWDYKAVFVSRVLMGAAFVLWKLPAGSSSRLKFPWVTMMLISRKMRCFHAQAHEVICSPETGTERNEKASGSVWKVIALRPVSL